MSPLIRFISWTVAIGNGGATANARRAIEERAQVDATLDALSARMSVPQEGAPQSGAAQAGDAQSGDSAPSRAA